MATTTKRPQPVKPTAGSLLDSLKANQKQTLEVPIAGSVITFRLPQTAQEFYALKQQADTFARATRRSPSAPYKPYKDLPAELLTQAYWIHALAVEPPFNQLEAVQLTDAGAALGYLYNSVMQEVGAALATLEAEALEESKNEFGMTDGTERNS